MALEKYSQKTVKLTILDLENLTCTSGLSRDALVQLASVAVRKTYNTNEYLWKMGEPGNSMAVIISGLIEINRFTSNDEEMTIGLFGPSDVIGISAVIKKTTYPGTAKVVADGTEVIKFYIRPVLQDKKSESIEVVAWVREMLLNHEQILRDKIDIINAPSVDCRIFELLKHLIRRFAQHESQIRHYIPLRLTRQQMGRLIDVRVETIIRTINRWKKMNLVQWTKEGILIENLTLLEKSLKRGKKRI